jgi:hypothetical protein
MIGYTARFRQSEAVTSQGMNQEKEGEKTPRIKAMIIAESLTFQGGDVHTQR